MNGFDKFCAVLAFIVGVVFLVFGGLGLFVGCRMWLELPPVLGVVPAFAGWGIVKPIRLAWKQSPPPPLPRRPSV